MKSFITLSLTSAVILGAAACHGGGGGNSNVGPNPGGVFGDDNPALEATVCHVPEGLVDGAYTLVIPSEELASHMAHGDTEGECVTDGPPFNDDDGSDGDGTDGDGTDGSGDDDDDDDTL
jgi:hypothetical protein